MLIVNCTLRCFAGRRPKLLQGSVPIHTAWGMLKRKEILVFLTAHSASADFLFSLGQMARGNYCFTFVWSHPVPQVALEQLPSCSILITEKCRLLCCNSIKQDWGKSYSRTFLKLSAAVGLFLLHVACKTLLKEAFSTCLLREVG